MKTFVVNEILANGDTVERYVDADGFRIDEDNGCLYLWTGVRNERGEYIGFDNVAVFPCIHWTSCVAQGNLAKTNQTGQEYKEPVSNIRITLSSEEMAEQIEHFAKEIPHSWQG